MLAELWAVVQSDWEVLALSSAAIFLAAIVRGFSGFGFSLLSITAIALILPVKQIVPSIFLLEIAASINLLPGIWREIHWRSLTWLMVGYVIGLPFGGYALAHAPEAPAQIVLGIFVIGTAILMWFALYAVATLPPRAFRTGRSGSAGHRASRSISRCGVPPLSAAPRSSFSSCSRMPWASVISRPRRAW